MSGCLRVPSSATYSRSKRCGRLKSNWTVESCHRRPIASNQFYVDLWAVEGGFSGDRLVFDIQFLQRAFQRMVGQVPLFVGAEKTFLVVGIPSGKLGLKFVESESLQHREGKLHAAYDFVFDLFGSAEDVSVVLSEAADAQQAMHHSGAFVAIDRAHFAEADGQIAI